ncbi:MAG: GDP-mannose 4,6-dehydratase, partial [Cyanobacteriota bacterium]|nr:GDP-mannose 4,6-dehydratase [Cyanobacteriota bacterium]
GEGVAQPPSSGAAPLSSSSAPAAAGFDELENWVRNAKDYVRAMWLMLQQDAPDDYVVATGETHTIRKFLDIAFGYVNLNWPDYVEFDARYLRPAEVDILIGDPTKAKQQLGWEPSVTFEQLVKLMVDADLAALGLPSPDGASAEQVLKDNAYIRQNVGSAVD